jgi:uncharacterized damage-inducible protein DinB
MGDFPDFPDNVRAVLAIDLEDGWEPDIGRLVWMLDAARRRTLEQLESIAAGQEQAIIDWRAGPQANSVGTTLYHLAAIEASWLYDEALEQPYPEEVEALFPYKVREEVGVLTHIGGQTLSEHLQRLEMCHNQLRSAYRTMTLDDFRRLHHLDLYSVTPEWVLHHLIQHEAEHRSQLVAARTMAERALGIRD